MDILILGGVASVVITMIDTNYSKEDIYRKLIDIGVGITAIYLIIRFLPSIIDIVKLVK